jgi:hypothetical protein
MNSAPERRRIVDCPVTVTARDPAPGNPALNEVRFAYEHQSRLLEAAFSSVRSLGDLEVAVRSELLEEIAEVCTVRGVSGMRLPTMNRC